MIVADKDALEGGADARNVVVDRATLEEVRTKTWTPIDETLP